MTDDVGLAPPTNGSKEAIISMLQKQSDSNQALLQCVKSLEEKQDRESNLVNRQPTSLINDVYTTQQQGSRGVRCHHSSSAGGRTYKHHWLGPRYNFPPHYLDNKSNRTQEPRSGAGT